MHFVFLTRGVKREVDQFISTLNAQYFPWKRTNLKTGKEEEALVQAAVRPLQLWEVIIPEEHKDLLLTSLEIDEKGKVHPLQAKGMTLALRKAMGLKPIRYTKTPQKRIIPREAVALYPIGLKKDKRHKWEEVGYEQEML